MVPEEKSSPKRTLPATRSTNTFFFGGKRVAMLPAGGNPEYYAEDFLGSSRVTTTNNGTVCYDADFYPYGGERAYTNNCPSANVYKFEGKERDTETGNDDFGARYYSNRFGRWLSADWSNVPVAVPYANLTNPQTLNLYAMVSDDPESFADLDGHVENAGQGGSIESGGVPTCASGGSGASGTIASGCTISTVTYETYDVHGSTAAEAAANAEKAGVAAPGYSGITNSSYTYTVTNETISTKQNSDGSFTVNGTADTVQLTMNITVKTPNWVDAKNASPEEQKAWSNFTDGLKKHEEGHVTIDKQGAKDLYQGLQKTSAHATSKTGPQAMSNAQRALKQMLAQKSSEIKGLIQRRNDDYDLQTNHGRSQ